MARIILHIFAFIISFAGANMFQQHLRDKEPPLFSNFFNFWYTFWL